MDSLLWGILGYVVLPIWLCIGLLDYATHQRTRIAATSGVRESTLHVVQAAQVGLPVLVVLFLEINALTLLIIAACVIAHTLTAYWDIAYTSTRRHISPFEQFVHAFMIVLPIVALLLLVILHWEQMREIANGGVAALIASSLVLRDAPWDAQVIVTVLVASVLLGFLPALAELVQTWRAAQSRHAGERGERAGP